MAISIGSKAPEILVATWIQGDPVRAFEAGQIYVLEFWATWCGPCRSAIPHLSKLAKAHAGKVTVIGVNVFERETQGTPKGIEAIEKFVRSMGDSMSYAVCVDGTDNYMAQAWMHASGRQGIPASFVVDGNGVIAWIGHPLGGLDDVIYGLLDGTFDLEAGKAALSEQENQQAEMQKRMQKLQPYIAAVEKGDYDTACREIDLLASDPGQDANGLQILRFQAAASCHREADAVRIAEQVIEEPGNRNALSIGMVVAELETASPTLVQLGIRAIESTMRQFPGMDHLFFFKGALATLYLRSGQQPRALSLATQAVDECRQAEGGAQLLSMLETNLHKIRHS